ncbi:TetR/AcrR family transcriptional regulator [bacterium]|nr:TetR/AcrR family transcriptional regulator [bacterium]
MKSSHRQRLIETTSRLLQAQGYRNTGLKQILDESETPRGSLYHYFPGGKDELVVAALGHASETVATTIAELCGAHAAPGEALWAVVEHFIAELETSSFEKGCPVATVALEQAAQNPVIQQACAQAYALWQGGLETYLQAHGYRQPAILAERLLVALEGALLLSRARLSAEPLRQLRGMLTPMLQQED